MNISWKNPPAAIGTGGDYHFIRGRFMQHTIRNAHQAGYEVVYAYSDAEVVDSLSMASTFSLPTLVVCDAGNVSPDTVSEHIKGKPKNVTLLIEAQSPLTDKIASTKPIHGAYLISFNAPKSKKGRVSDAEKFIRQEVKTLMGSSDAIDPRLPSNLAKSLAEDFGRLAFMLSKASALARFQGEKTIGVEHIRATARSSSEVAMQPLRDALARGDEAATAKALHKIKEKSVSDPTMLLLRAKGGPADLAFQWLRVLSLSKVNRDVAFLSSALGVPDWIVRKEYLPAANRWGEKSLRQLVKNLAYADRGTLKGIPSPWVACVAALLQGCRSIASQ